MGTGGQEEKGQCEDRGGQENRMRSESVTRDKRTGRKLSRWWGAEK